MTDFVPTVKTVGYFRKTLNRWIRNRTINLFLLLVPFPKVWA